MIRSVIPVAVRQVQVRSIASIKDLPVVRLHDAKRKDVDEILEPSVPKVCLELFHSSILFHYFVNCLVFSLVVYVNLWHYSCLPRVEVDAPIHNAIKGGRRECSQFRRHDRRANKLCFHFRLTDIDNANTLKSFGVTRQI
ncbi:hypothetical protein Y032_0771g2226 [Ancylostoma ceylanicum]|uniref:Uncharacterized protein n=1 Tax=Ancylostoma ceylanicum TaxID=53326 RepID=A0A016WDJ1_9BILA|nr:hypothetical protein Y032_0771g2226 [Ancylostoma ceylanicum]